MEMNRSRPHCFLLSFTICCLLLVAFAPASYGQRSRNIGLIGKINLKAILLLHPSMAHYSPERMAFRLNTPAPQTNSEVSSAYKGEIDEINKQIRSLNAKLEEVRGNSGRKMMELSDRYLSGLDELATGSRGMRKQQYLIDSGRTEASFNATMNAIIGQIAVLERNLDRFTRVASDGSYTSPDDTQKRFFAIINEVRQYTQKVAADKNIQVVLNSSYSNYRLQASEESPLPSDMEYGKVFATPFRRDIADDAAAISGYYSALTSIAANWLKHGDMILSPFRGMLVNNDVFIGGVDLTPEVLASIFRTYKIDPNIGNALIQSMFINTELTY